MFFINASCSYQVFFHPSIQLSTSDAVISMDNIYNLYIQCNWASDTADQPPNMLLINLRLLNHFGKNSTNLDHQHEMVDMFSPSIFGSWYINWIYPPQPPDASHHQDYYHFYVREFQTVTFIWIFDILDWGGVDLVDIPLFFKKTNKSSISKHIQMNIQKSIPNGSGWNIPNGYIPTVMDISDLSKMKKKPKHLHPLLPCPDHGDPYNPRSCIGTGGSWGSRPGWQKRKGVIQDILLICIDCL